MSNTTIRRHYLKIYAINLLTGLDEPCCIDCGVITDISNIDFHHLYPELKTGNPSELMRKSRDAFLIEVLTRHCIPLCKECHKARHSKG